MPDSTWQKEKLVAVDAARAAGEEIRRIRADGQFDVEHKADQQGPVTTADLRSNEILRAQLLNAFPDDGWLSEETREDHSRLEAERVWIVDPIDGTREFVQDIPEYCVSVALVEQGKPVVGVVYCPGSEELFVAVSGQGAWCNGKPIRARRGQDDAKPLLAVSRSEVGKGKWQAFEHLAALRPAGSAAFKLCLVASGQVDGTMTLAPRNEWDIAAGVLIVTEAGGVATDRAGEPIPFNQPDPLKNGIAAASSQRRTDVYDVLNATLANNPAAKE
jgi:myo-inositol-1(or 4)-monophosphatase